MIVYILDYIFLVYIDHCLLSQYVLKILVHDLVFQGDDHACFCFLSLEKRREIYKSIVYIQIKFRKNKKTHGVKFCNFSKIFRFHHNIYPTCILTNLCTKDKSTRRRNIIGIWYATKIKTTTNYCISVTSVRDRNIFILF